MNTLSMQLTHISILPAKLADGLLDVSHTAFSVLVHNMWQPADRFRILS